MSYAFLGTLLVGLCRLVSLPVRAILYAIYRVISLDNLCFGHLLFLLYANQRFERSEFAGTCRGSFLKGGALHTMKK